MPIANLCLGTPPSHVLPPNHRTLLGRKLCNVLFGSRVPCDCYISIAFALKLCSAYSETRRQGSSSLDYILPEYQVNKLRIQDTSTGRGVSPFLNEPTPHLIRQIFSSSGASRKFSTEREKEIFTLPVHLWTSVGVRQPLLTA